MPVYSVPDQSVGTPAPIVKRERRADRPPFQPVQAAKKKKPPLGLPTLPVRPWQQPSFPNEQLIENTRATNLAAACWRATPVVAVTVRAPARRPNAGMGRLSRRRGQTKTGKACRECGAEMGPQGYDPVGWWQIRAHSCMSSSSKQKGWSRSEQLGRYGLASQGVLDAKVDTVGAAPGWPQVVLAVPVSGTPFLGHPQSSIMSLVRFELAPKINQ